ncbi:KN motif and ankyrin repeat domain-containing protein 3 [Diaporthe eres]
MSGHLDASDLHLIYDELIELTTMLEDVSQLNTKTFSGTPKENLDILRAIYRDIRVILKTFEDVREMCPSVEDVSPNNPELSSNSEVIAERRPRRPIKERITIISRLFRERRLSLLSKLVVLNTRDVDSIKEAVLRKRVSVTDVLDTGMTPIGFALRHFSVPMVRFLLQEGADLFQEGPSGVAPPGFMMALEKIYTDPDMPTSDRTLLEELLPLDTIIEMAGLSPLHKVVLGIRCLDLGELLRLEVCPVDKLDYSGRTALHWAAAKGDATAVAELLDAGAQLECKTRLRSESPLMIACRTGANPEAVRVLLAAGADVNTHDSYGQTPLCLTAGAPGGHSRIEIAAALLEAGANINVEQGYARATALDFACVGSHFEMVKFLIDAGADIGHHDRDGSTPLSK